MWEAVILTLAATAGQVLQKKGTFILPPLFLKLKVIRTHALNKPWIAGILMDIGGAILMVRALSLAPELVLEARSRTPLLSLSSTFLGLICYTHRVCNLELVALYLQTATKGTRIGAI